MHSYVRDELDKKMATAIKEVEQEAMRASCQYPPFASAHEGFAIMMEEFDELKEHVWMNQKKRDIAAMRKEAVQVAAMALRFIVDVT